MEQIRISAKNLGELLLSSFCPRCFWIKRHVKTLPYQIFPGVFSSIDSYSKKITGHYYGKHRELMRWFVESKLVGKPLDVPHHSVYAFLHTPTNVLLTGAPDEIIELSKGGYCILDYKTAKFTNTQDELLPMYEVQLNAYAFIGEHLRFRPVKNLFLLYYEPRTDIGPDQIDSFVFNDGFKLHFSQRMFPIPLKIGMIPALLEKVRELYDLPRAPAGKNGCKDCQAIDSIVRILS